jgi:hypothetical protein
MVRSKKADADNPFMGLAKEADAGDRRSWAKIAEGQLII